jgi:tripartite-type tricarboxylate transporter receptor subunit TctC
MKRIGLGVLFLLLYCSPVSAQAPYFQGKTIRIVVGYPAGSAHDLWARLIAPQLTKQIPGNPATIVQQMPGAGSMTATNYVYSVSKPDGLTLGINNAALYFAQLLKQQEVQYDWSKLSWVGSTTRTSPLLNMWANTPYKTIHDVRTASVPPKCGATGTGNTGYYLPRVLEETIGTKFQLVTGYQGGADIEIAVERGEVQCRAFTIQVFYGREPVQHVAQQKPGSGSGIRRKETRPAHTRYAVDQRIVGSLQEFRSTSAARYRYVRLGRVWCSPDVRRPRNRA